MKLIRWFKIAKIKYQILAQIVVNDDLNYFITVSLSLFPHHLKLYQGILHIFFAYSIFLFEYLKNGQVNLQPQLEVLDYDNELQEKYRIILMGK